jgi:hypothetical protein
MNNNTRILDGKTLQEAIFRCGELQLPYEQVILLLAPIHPVDPIRLLTALQTPGTDQYEWYQQGVAEGNLKLNIDLEANIDDPKAKDAYKHLSAERLRQAINHKLEDLFGI